MNIDQILADHGFGGGTVVKGTAAAGDVLNSKTFMSATGKGLLTGSMPENGGVTITPGPNDIAIPAGHHDGTGKVSKVVVNAAHLLTGDTVAGTAGTMPNNGAVTITPSNADQAIPAGYHSGAGKVPAVTFDASKLLTGTTVAGTAGTMPNNGSPTLQPGASITPGYYSGGTVAQPNPASGSQTFTSSGNFTVPTGVTRLMVLMIGAGGGGGGGAGSQNYAAGCGAGGGSGSWLAAFVDVTPGQVIPITIGQGGSGGIGATTSGGNGTVGSEGGTTSFGSILSLPGGYGGGGGPGGQPSASGGLASVGGGYGIPNNYFSTMISNGVGGNGTAGYAAGPNGNNPGYNSGGGGTTAFPNTPYSTTITGAAGAGNSNPGNNGSTPGGGGGGGAGGIYNNAGGYNGGTGGNGQIKIQW